MDLLEVLVWVGTITFAITGALVGVEKRFDVVGVLVLGAVTAIGGGSIRDLLAGVIPPPALTNEPLLWTIAFTCLVVFVAHRFVPDGITLYIFDTLGLAVFAALGASTALGLGFGFWGTVFAAAVSGVGGGVIRDLLAGEVPGILYRSGDFYATAAALGGAVVFLADGWGEAALILGILAAALLRVGSRLANLKLPVPRSST